MLFDGDAVLTQAGRPLLHGLYALQECLAAPPARGRGAVARQRRGALAKPLVACGVPSLADIGFAAVDLAGSGVRPGMSGAAERLADFRERMPRYREQRDFPAVKGVSYLSPHLRFGTVSIRQLVREALQGAARAA